MLRMLLAGLVLASSAPSSPAPAQDDAETDHHVVRAQNFGWWGAELQILLGHGENGRRIVGLSCLLRGQDGVAVRVTRPAESAMMLTEFTFDLEEDRPEPDPELSERRVVSLGIGGRTYQFDRIEWRFSPQFMGWESPPRGVKVLLPYGISKSVVRSGEDFPWLPVEYLILPLMEVETLRLGYRGDREITHGDHETVYRERTIRMSGFRGGMRWCGEAIRSERAIELPPELIRSVRRPQ